MTREDRIRRAERAQELLNDPIVSEALAKMEDKVLQDFTACAPDDDEGRLASQIRLKCVREFKAEIRATIIAGKQAAIPPANIG